MAKARVLARSRRVRGGAPLADEAVEIVDRTDYLVGRGTGTRCAGMVLEAAGRGDDARAAFEEALARYERKGNVVAAARIRARLERLGSG